MHFQSVYNDDGILIQQNDAATNNSIWHISSLNAMNKVVQMEYGNGYAVNNYYNIQDNSLLKTNHSNGSNTVIDVNYDFDVNKGILKSRNDLVFNKNELFQYDLLNRLTKESTNGTLINEYSYDKRGRMTGNTEIGQYKYNNNDYRLQSISFNANGQQVEANRGFAEFKFNEFNSPISIKVENKENLAFKYNLMKERYSMQSTISNEKKYYSSD